MFISYKKTSSYGRYVRVLPLVILFDRFLFFFHCDMLSVKTSSAPSSEKTAMVSLQVPESNSTLVKLHDYCKQDCTFSDYINYAVGRGQQLLSARPTAAYINKG